MAGATALEGPVAASARRADVSRSIAPSGDHDGIESPPLEVSCVAASSVWIQMLPALAYTIEPSNAASSGTTTTFDGAGVRAGVPRRSRRPPFDRRRRAERHLAVEQVQRDDADEHAGRRRTATGRDDRCRPARRRTDRRCAGRARARGAGHDGRSDATGADAGRRAGPPPPAWAPLGAASRISSCSDSNPPNVRLASRATTSMRSPSWTSAAMSAGRRRSRRARRDRAAGSATCGPSPARRTRVTVSPRTATSGCGIAGAVRRERGRGHACRRVVDVERGHGEVDRAGPPADRTARTPARSPRTARRTRASDRRAARTRPRRRGRRGG